MPPTPPKSINQLLLESQDLTWFHIRLHLEEEWNLERVLESFKAKSNRFIVSVEHAERKHFHCMVSFQTMDIGKNHQNVRNFVQKVFSVKKNKAYSISRVKTESRMAMYVVKDGSFMSSGFTEDELTSFRNKSYKKFTKKDFATELDDIRCEYIDSRDTCKAIESIIVLKADYNQTFNQRTIESLIMTWRVKFDKDYLTSMARRIDNKLKEDYEYFRPHKHYD